MKYPQNFWYVSASSDELADEPLGRIICEEPVVLFRTADGTAVALQDFCPHRGLPLSKGRCENDGIRCGYHGMLVDRHGQCASMPNQPRVSRLKGVKTFALAQYGNPSLTTIRQNIRWAGRVLVESLLSIINKEKIADTTLSSELVVRQSSGAKASGSA